MTKEQIKKLQKARKIKKTLDAYDLDIMSRAKESIMPFVNQLEKDETMAEENGGSSQKAD